MSQGPKGPQGIKGAPGDRGPIGERVREGDKDVGGQHMCAILHEKKTSTFDVSAHRWRLSAVFSGSGWDPRKWNSRLQRLPGTGFSI